MLPKYNKQGIQAKKLFFYKLLEDLIKLFNYQYTRNNFIFFKIMNLGFEFKILLCRRHYTSFFFTWALVRKYFSFLPVVYQ